MFRSNAPVSDNRSTLQETQPSTRILVIGAGYAGLLFTMRLAGKVARQNIQIALVNDSDTFTERPRLPQFATNQVIQWRSLPQMLRQTHVQFLQGRVTSLDPAHHEIVITHGQQTQHVGYDYLVYALGSETDRKTVPGVADYAYTLAAGFNNYPDDKPIPPYFTGWLGYQIREAFVRYLAAPPRFERGWPGLFVWPGKRRYEAAQRRQQAQAKNDSMQLHHV